MDSKQGISVAVFCCARKIINTEEFTKIVSSDLCVNRMLTLPLPPQCWFFVIVVGVCCYFEIVSLCNPDWTQSHGSPPALAS